MTPAERALLLDLFRWARKSGIVNVGWRGNPVWRYRWNTAGVYGVAHQRGLHGIAVAAGGPHVDYRCETIGQAVDILAALGAVPARYSSAYRAGWVAALDIRTWDAEHFPAHPFTDKPESEPAR